MHEEGEWAKAFVGWSGMVKALAPKGDGGRPGPRRLLRDVLLHGPQLLQVRHEQGVGRGPQEGGGRDGPADSLVREELAGTSATPPSKARFDELLGQEPEVQGGAGGAVEGAPRRAGGEAVKGPTVREGVAVRPSCRPPVVDYSIGTSLPRPPLRSGLGKERWDGEESHVAGDEVRRAVRDAGRPRGGAVRPRRGQGQAGPRRVFRQGHQEDRRRVRQD